MKFALALTLIAASLPCQAKDRADQMCAPLRAFVVSVKPDETRKLEFQTSWGANFKGSSEPALYAKSCVHDKYAPAKAACDYLMEHGAVEFSGNNAMRALSCLSPGTRFGNYVQLNQAEFSFSYGTDNRGSNITLKYGEDPKLGAMVLSITADGY